MLIPNAPRLFQLCSVSVGVGAGVGVGVGVYEPLCVMEDEGECHLFRYGSTILSSRPEFSDR